MFFFFLQFVEWIERSDLLEDSPTARTGEVHQHHQGVVAGSQQQVQVVLATSWRHHHAYPLPTELFHNCHIWKTRPGNITVIIA